MKHRLILQMMAAFGLTACWQVASLESETGGNAGNDVDTDPDILPVEITGTDEETDSDLDTNTDVETDSEMNTNLDCPGGRWEMGSGLCWQHPKAEGTYQWQDAIDYCDSLDLAGHKDWYLPSRKDFINLLGGCDSDVLSGKSGYCKPCPNNLPCGAMFDSGAWHWYWSSSPAPNNPGWAWNIGFCVGKVGQDVVELASSVRCVRPEP